MRINRLLIDNRNSGLQS